MRPARTSGLTFVLEGGVVGDVVARPQSLCRRALATRRCGAGTAGYVNPAGAGRPFGGNDLQRVLARVAGLEANELGLVKRLACISRARRSRARLAPTSGRRAATACQPRSP